MSDATLVKLSELFKALADAAPILNEGAILDEQNKAAAIMFNVELESPDRNPELLKVFRDKSVAAYTSVLDYRLKNAEIIGGLIQQAKAGKAAGKSIREQFEEMTSGQQTVNLGEGPSVSDDVAPPNDWATPRLVSEYVAGDIVYPVEGEYLSCGSSQYSRAVVVSANPPVLVSEDADMLWRSTITAQKFTKGGVADSETMKRLTKRLLDMDDVVSFSTTN